MHHHPPQAANPDAVATPWGKSSLVPGRRLVYSEQRVKTKGCFFELTIRGRGAAHNPPNRFETLSLVPDPEAAEPNDIKPPTQFLKDPSRSILSRNDSPDVGFEVSVNPYRGCEHGCVYCYARPTHEYLGFSAGLDFETKILVKERAADLLRQELSSPKWVPQPIALSGVTDPYQPVERRLGITRQCLQALAEFLNPVIIVTKNHLVTRDIDVLQELSRHKCAAVSVSVTTLDPELQRTMEPRASSPRSRLSTIEKLSRAGVPVRVMAAPVIPGLNDHELPGILKAASRVGAVGAGYIMLRLPHGVKGLFEDWLQRHFPDRRERVMNRVREVRNGRLNDPRFHARMRGEGEYAEQINNLFELARRKAGFVSRLELSTQAFRLPGRGRQMTLFSGRRAERHQPTKP